MFGAEHVVVENPADTVAPGEPADVRVTVNRGVGAECFAGFCSSSSCDDIGSVSLTFPASLDDVSVTDPGSASGCATVGGAGALATLLALGLAGARRRRG